MSMHVFAYGSLMFERVWSKVIGGSYERVGGRLYGYKRFKVRGEVYPALIPGTNLDYVDGLVYLNISQSDMKTLDRFEGHCYRKETVECKLPDRGKITVLVYVFEEKYTSLIEDEEWDPVWFSEVGIHSFLTEYRGFG